MLYCNGESSDVETLIAIRREAEKQEREPEPAGRQG
jgi:hypothetical protein